jgi:hypothetical protein
MRTLLAWMIVGSASLVAVSCAGDDDEHAGAGAGGGENATCRGFVEMLTDCQVIKGSRFKGCEDDDPTLTCIAACVAKVSCDEIKATYCFHSFNTYAECLQDCGRAAKPPDFTCGDGSTVSARWQCDGVADCPGGEDEDCPDGTFDCAGGPPIPAGWHCDGFEDCTGGDDEADCGPALVCDDGTSLPSSKECNGDMDCAGGEDELDCTTLTCT